MFINPLYFYNQAYLFIKGIEGVITFSPLTVIIFKLLWFGLGFLFFSLAIIFTVKKNNLLKVEKAMMDEEIKNLEDSLISGEKNTAWEKITKYLESTNPSDWKLAILEADTILDSIMQKMGYRGENLGERLKGVEPSDFLTLNDAWEAHKVRNSIAHESGFQIDYREAKRVVRLYENVFKEFNYL